MVTIAQNKTDISGTPKQNCCLARRRECMHINKDKMKPTQRLKHTIGNCKLKKVRFKCRFELSDL